MTQSPKSFAVLETCPHASCFIKTSTSFYKGISFVLESIFYFGGKFGKFAFSFDGIWLLVSPFEIFLEAPSTSTSLEQKDEF